MAERNIAHIAWPSASQVMSIIGSQCWLAWILYSELRENWGMGVGEMDGTGGPAMRFSQGGAARGMLLKQQY